jgi:hypothetical protein
MLFGARGGTDLKDMRFSDVEHLHFWRDFLFFFFFSLSLFPYVHISYEPPQKHLPKFVDVLSVNLGFSRLLVYIYIYVHRIIYIYIIYIYVYIIYILFNILYYI